MMFMFQRVKDPKWIVGIVISLIVLAMGAFLYMHTEGDDHTGLDDQSDQQVASSTTSGSSSSSVTEVSVQGEPMTVSDGQDNKPFIMAIIPEKMDLIDGAYRAAAGSTIRVRVRAINVVNGTLYYKSKDSKQVDVQQSEKVSDLKPSDLPGEYETTFKVDKNTAGLLVAVMKGTDGQEVQLSVNVASKR